MPRTIGVDVGGTKLLALVVEADGSVVGERLVPSPGPWVEIRAAIVEAVDELQTAHGAVAAVGIGAAGMVGRDGSISYAPNNPGFRATPVRAEIAEAVGCPVSVDNDANAAALAEVRLGAARGHDDVLAVTLGTGIGGGIVVGGRVVRGANGFAGEIGHFTIDPDGPWCACGERGHWEAYASGHALGRMGREAAASGGAPSVVALAGGDASTVAAPHVTAAAREGAPDALALVDRYAQFVATGMVGLANILDPSIIVVAGGLAEEGDLILDPVRRHFGAHLEGGAWRTAPAIVPAELGARAGAVGAGLAAHELVTASDA